MVSITDIPTDRPYRCTAPVDLFKTVACQGLVTQAATGRHLRILSTGEGPDSTALFVCLCEDDYPGWLPIAALQHLAPAEMPYHPPSPAPQEIAAALPAVIEFALQAMQRPNTYLWGGTVGPNFDCSGLVQTAFAAAGIRLPRDSYQQEAFVDAIALDQLRPGDLLFFGLGDRPNHVALFLGEGKYIHSSGRDQGRNGIGIDSITDLTDPISNTYFRQIRGAGRVSRSYQPQGDPMPCR